MHGRGNSFDRAPLGRKMELSAQSIIPDHSFKVPLTWGHPGADVSLLPS